MLIFSTYNLLGGLIIIWNVETGNANFRGRLPDFSLISTLFDKFIKPYLETWDLSPTPRASVEIDKSVERVVNLKIKQLRPFLQDDDIEESETDNEITFEGNDETTIVEFVPQISEKSKVSLRYGNDTLKANMQRYKKIRTKIYHALEAEKVSEKTKRLVIRTFDELLSKIVETQCHWKGGTEDTGDNINSRFIVPRTMLNTWRKEWKKLKTKFSTLVHVRAKNKVNNIDSLMTYFTKLNSIINDVMLNLDSFTKQYKVRCNITDRKLETKNKITGPKPDALRFSYNSDTDENKCKHFKVCSNELKTFFIEFYNSVNDTTVNVLRSYAEMYIRDVNTDVSNEKSSIVDLIFKIADETEENATKVFTNNTVHFKLDEHKEKEKNVNLLIEYVKNIVQHIKDEINKNMYVKLNHLHKKISSGIQQDILVNLDVDLGNLERDFISKICLIFSICNGNLKNRRFGGDDLEKKHSRDSENKIYVKVELSIDEGDDALKHNATKTSASISELNTSNNSDDVAKFRKFKGAKTFNYQNYANITVTRTTPMQAP